jgi:formylmethanofuran dehydrogenase subunit E
VVLDEMKRRPNLHDVLSSEKNVVRFALTPEFMDAMVKFEFFSYRKRGVEPSGIPAAVAEEVTQWVFDQSDEFMFKVEPKLDFKFTPAKGSFNKTKCSACGEYVFDRYVRMKEGQPLCIPCSGY